MSLPRTGAPSEESLALDSVATTWPLDASTLDERIEKSLNTSAELAKKLQDALRADNARLKKQIEALEQAHRSAE